MSKYSILLVNDDPLVLQILFEYLNEDNPSYNILQALDGIVACKIAEKHLPDLIITDWQMPHMDGIETIKYLQSQPTTREIPIIMSSGVMVTSANLKIALESGAVDYIKKPIDPIELTARVRSMLKLSDSYRQIKYQNQQLSKLNTEIDTQRKELEEQRNLVFKQNQEITHSLMYATRIQKALLLSKTELHEILPEHFLLFKPRDIISGDFYWVRQKESLLMTVVADSTGHGVPGAFLSILGINFLYEITTNNSALSAGNILDILRHKIKQALNQKGTDNESKDGMDISLCIIDREKMTLQFAGAYQPLYFVRESNKNLSTNNLSNYESCTKDDYTLFEIKSDRQPIGIYVKEAPFSTHYIDLCQGDQLYTFSDGYVDQIGGENQKKFMSKNFKLLLLDICSEPLVIQRSKLMQNLKHWTTARHEQVDDILVLGIKI